MKITVVGAGFYGSTTVQRIAATYARTHPDARPLGPDEEGEAQPSTSATAQVDIVDVSGPYLSFEYHVDVDLPGHRPWHSTRRGVVDLRSGKASGVADLFGQAVAKRLTTAGRRGYELTRDSIVRDRALLRGTERRAADALARLQFDERSFTLSDVDGQPAVSFGVPGYGEGAAGNLVELDPLPVDSVIWWRDVRGGLPQRDSVGTDRWTGSGYAVVAGYDTSGRRARLSITDPSTRDWLIATVTPPLRRIDWLDRPAPSDVARTALIRAFNAAANYDENARVASSAGRGAWRVASLPLEVKTVHRPRPAANVSHRAHAPHQVRQRKPARDVRAHDAPTCEQHGARVRRSDLVDHGQMRGDRGFSSQPGGRRHGVDRPRGFSGTDPLGRSGDHEGQRQFRRPDVDGSGSACRR